MNGKLTAAACRAGRALLGWTVRDLMREAGVSPNTVTGFEGGAEIREATAQKILDAFGRHDVEITNGDGTGARLRFAGTEPRSSTAPEGLPAFVAIWRVQPSQERRGLWVALRDPASDKSAVYAQTRKGVEHALETRGFVRSDVDEFVWQEP